MYKKNQKSFSHKEAQPSFAYVFERFPSFTQTFCVREVLEVERQGLRTLIFSIRDTRDEEGLRSQFPPELVDRVVFLPPYEKLRDEVRAWKDEGTLPRVAARTLRLWQELADKSDKARVYEACWIGKKMALHSLRHAHCHFAGVAARTCWWLGQFFGYGYSITGHAQDIFCEDKYVLKLDRLLMDATHVNVVSEFSAKFLRTKMSLSPIVKLRSAAKRISCVYNGIDITPFAKANEIRTANSFEFANSKRRNERIATILSIGRLIEKKGFADLISACAIVAENLQRKFSKKKEQLNFRCLIVGDGELKDSLQEQIETLNLQKRVILVGKAPLEYIIEQMTEADVFALACVETEDGDKDNLPTVIMEAMAAGLPCVSTSVAGVPEMIADHVTGYIVEAGNPDELARALTHLLEDEEEAASMGRRGMSRVGRYFAKEKTASLFIGRIMRYAECRVGFAFLKENPRLFFRRLQALPSFCMRRFRSLLLKYNKPLKKLSAVIMLCALSSCGTVGTMGRNVFRLGTTPIKGVGSTLKKGISKGLSSFDKKGKDKKRAERLAGKLKNNKGESTLSISGKSDAHYLSSRETLGTFDKSPFYKSDKNNFTELEAEGEKKNLDSDLPSIGDMLENVESGEFDKIKIKRSKAADIQTWYDDIFTAAKSAQRQMRPLVVYFFYSGLAGSRKALEAEVFQNKEFKKLIKDYSCLLARLDYSLKSRKLGGNDFKTYDRLRRENRLKGFPSLLIFKPNGEVCGRVSGYKPGSRFTYLQDFRSELENCVSETEKMRDNLATRGFTDWQSIDGRTFFAKFLGVSADKAYFQFADALRSTTKLEHLHNSALQKVLQKASETR